MSYCRWSSFIHNKVPIDAYFDNEKSFEEIAKEYNDEVSDWYIYHDCSSGEDKDSQMLAIWHVKGETPLFSYPEVKEMYEADNFGILEEYMTQREFMKKCVKSWLDYIEEDYAGKD